MCGIDPSQVPYGGVRPGRSVHRFIDDSDLLMDPWTTSLKPNNPYWLGIPKDALSADTVVTVGPDGTSTITSTAFSNKRKISKDDLEKIFQPAVTQAFKELKAAIDEVKGASSLPRSSRCFIPSSAHRTALVALEHGDYNNKFFDYLPTIFPSGGKKLASAGRGAGGTDSGVDNAWCDGGGRWRI